jgi:hypothetical protein
MSLQEGRLRHSREPNDELRRFRMAIDSPRLKRVLTHWEAARGGRVMPAWQDNCIIQTDQKRDAARQRTGDGTVR